MANANKGILMGLGDLSKPDLVFKRKYRWTFQVEPFCGPVIPAAFVKLASRPNLTIEETEINFLHGKMWIPGKGSWETITVTYYDIGNAGDGITGLFSWLATVYNFTDPEGLSQSSKIGNGAGSGGYAAIGYLDLYDGCGVAMEEWKLEQLWPQAINFGELDYSSSEEVTIELTLRYTNVTYTPFCGGEVNPCCEGCDSGSPTFTQGLGSSQGGGGKVLTA
jgi:hypothetical protein